MSLSILKNTTSSEGELSPSNLQCVTVDASNCIPYPKCGFAGLTTPYASIFVIAMSARLVIGAVVLLLRMTCKKGCNRLGVSNWWISLQLFKSTRSFAKALMSGLSCMLWPLRPRRPHREVRAESVSSETSMVEPLRSVRRASEGVRRGEGAEEPRMEEMELWAQRACLRMAEVTVMHSVTTSATGSIATGTGPERRGRGRPLSAMVVLWCNRRSRRCNVYVMYEVNGNRESATDKHGLLRARNIELNCCEAVNVLHNQCLFQIRAKWQYDR